MQLLKQSQTAEPIVFLMLDDADHVTGKTGLSPTVTIRKPGGAFASPSGAVTEIANGWYQIAGNATDTNTLGPLLIHAEASGADPCDAVAQVVAFDPRDSVRAGLTALPNAAAGANTGLPVVGTQIPNATAAATGGLPTVDSGGRVTANVTQFGGSAGTFSGGRPEVNTTHVGGSAVSQSGGLLNANVTQISGDSGAADNAEAFFDGTGYAGTNNVIPTVTTVSNQLSAATIAAAVRDVSNASPSADSLGDWVKAGAISAAQGSGYAEAANTKLGTPAASVSADIAAVKTDTGNLVTRITSTLFSGITSLAQWLGAMAGKQTGNTTARNELRATGAGSGTFDETTDSLQALADAAVSMPDVDGLTHVETMRTLLAHSAGVRSVASNVVTFMQQDGETPQLRQTIGSTPGEVTASEIEPEA